MVSPGADFARGRDSMDPQSGMEVDDENRVYDVTQWRKNMLTAVGGGSPADPGYQELVTRGAEVSAINPLDVDGDSVYPKDLDLSRSDIGDFAGDTIDGLFDDLYTTMVDATANNPKSITIMFVRGQESSGIALGAANGNFSNVRAYGVASGGAMYPLFDQSADDTKRTSWFFPFTAGVSGFTGIKLEFLTTDEVSLSNIKLNKSQQVAAAIQAIQPDGSVVFAGATSEGNLKIAVQEYGDTPSIDAFARLRMSEPFTLFDSKQLHDKQPLFWNESLGGAAGSTHNPVDADVEMTVTANSSDFVIRQTKQRFNYQPGKSQLIFMTFRSLQVTGVTSRIGCFDGTGVNNLTPKNGIFFRCDGDLSWNIAKNGTTTETVTQANWNLDSLDGTGPSGLTLDVDACQILVIDYEWLGVGRVRAGFVIDGLVRYVHYFNHANTAAFTSVYMSTPNLPLRYDIQAGGVNDAGELDHICSTVMSEGGLEETGVRRSVDTGTTHVDADSANTTYAVKGIKLKSGYLDVTVIPEFFSMINEAGDDFRWSLCLNPTIAGTFTYSDVDNSAVQEATGATANTVSDEGVVMDSGYVVAGAFGAGGEGDRKFTTNLRMGSLIDGTADEIVLCVTPLTGGADIQGSLTFRELL